MKLIVLRTYSFNITRETVALGLPKLCRTSASSLQLLSVQPLCLGQTFWHTACCALTAYVLFVIELMAVDKTRSFLVKEVSSVKLFVFESFILKMISALRMLIIISQV